MHFVKHLSTSIMNINTISKGEGQKGSKGGQLPPARLPKWNPAEVAYISEGYDADCSWNKQVHDEIRNFKITYRYMSSMELKNNS